MQSPNLFLKGLAKGLLSKAWLPVAVIGALSFALLATPESALAQCLTGGPASCLTSINTAFSFVGGGTRSFPTIVSDIIRAFLSLLGIIFIGMILFAGYNWMTAMGEAEKVKTAKSTLVSAVIGLVLIIASYAITTFVLIQLGST